MKKVSSILLLFLLAISSVIASNEPTKGKDAKSTCTISGTIVDKISGEPLAGVEIKLVNSDQQLYSDLDGKFEIKDVQPGNHSILINLISYQEYVENVETEKGNTSKVEIELKSVEK